MVNAKTNQRGFLAIHTSDRTLFKRCRRKWDFRSTIRRNLVPTTEGPNIHLWFGTGFHFALEDYHGYNRFGDPVKALEAYYNAFTPEQLPEGAEDIIATGMGMMDYYVQWLERRDIYKTVWVEGVPLVEVKFQLELPPLSDEAEMPVFYRGTIDRVVEDPYGRWWVQDYKTAARIDTAKLANDVQSAVYVWAGEQWFQREIEGMLYTQFLKDTPAQPRVNANGSLSVNKTQRTTHSLYKRALDERFPSGNYPPKYIEFLNTLAERETPEGDAFIRRDELRINEYAKENMYYNILSEGYEMIDPDLAIYPNPTRDCSWDCKEYRTACIAMEEGDDYEYMLDTFYQEEGEMDESWRSRIKWPT